MNVVDSCRWSSSRNGLWPQSTGISCFFVGFTNSSCFYRFSPVFTSFWQQPFVFDSLVKDADFKCTGEWVMSEKNRSGGCDEVSSQILGSGIFRCGHLRFYVGRWGCKSKETGWRKRLVTSAGDDSIGVRRHQI